MAGAAKRETRGEEDGDAQGLRLKRHPREAGYDASSLAAAIAAHDWEAADAPVGFEAMLRERLAAAAGHWHKLATETGRPLSLAVRNLIACAGPEDLGVWWLFLALDQGGLQSGIGRDAAAIRALLPKPAPCFRIALALVQASRRPTLRETLELAPSRPDRVVPVLRDHLATTPDGGEDHWMVRLARQLRLEAGPPLDALIEALGKVGTGRGTRPKLVVGAVEALPPAWRRALLNSLRVRKNLIERGTVALFRSEPEIFPDSPEARLRAELADQAPGMLKAGKLTSEPLLVVASSPRLFKARRRALALALPLVPLRSEADARQVEGLRTSLRKLAAEGADPVALALLALLTPHGRLPSFLGSIPTTAVVALFRLLPVHALGAALAALEPATRRHVLADQASRRPARLAGAISGPLWLDPILRADLTASLSEAQQADVLDRGHLGLADLWRLAEKLPLATRPLCKRLAQLQPGELARQLLAEDRLARLKVDKADADGLARLAFKGTLKLKDQGVRDRCLWNGLRLAPVALFDVVDGVADPAIFASLANASAVAGLPTPFLPRLLDLAGPDGRLLPRHLAGGGLLHDRLEAFIASDKTRLTEALDVAPRRFLAVALDRLEPLQLVLFAVRKRSFAKEVERSLGRDRIAATALQVGAALAKRPCFAAACEIAARIGLHHLGYLTLAALRLAPPFQRPELGHRLDDQYKTHELPKKSGGKRLIAAPVPALKAAQRALLRHGFSALELHEAATGFRPGLSILDNAKRHVASRVVVNVDIRGFFPSTSYEQVLSVCRRLWSGAISPLAARLVAELCCHNGALATGAPTSPAVANAVLLYADGFISRAAERRNIAYSRYADDLTFSGDVGVAGILPFVRRVLAGLGYELDPKKTNIFRRGRRQVVTGLVVNDKPNLPRTIRRRLRAAVHRRTHGGQALWHGRPMSDGELLGRIAHLQLVQPEEARRLRAELKRRR